MGYVRFEFSREEERALVIAAKAGDQRAQARLIEQFHPLIRSMAWKRKGFAVDVEDLQQEGRMGLLRALQSFDPDRFDNRFHSYAHWWVKAYIDQYVMRNWSGFTTKLSGPRGWRFLMAMNSAGARPRSLDEPDRNGEIRDIDDGAKPIDEGLAERQETEHRRAHLDALMQPLGKNERLVISSRWLCEDAKTLDEISVQLGISRQRVQQIEMRALQKMGIPDARQRVKEFA